MKRLFAIILSVLMLFALCACTAAPADTTGTPDITDASGVIQLPDITGTPDPTAELEVIVAPGVVVKPDVIIEPDTTDAPDKNDKPVVSPDLPDEQSLKVFTVIVVHGDETQRTFTYETGEKKLGAYLEAEGVIESAGADDGMFHTVDGEKADWNKNQSYWAFYINGEYAMTGIYDTEITDGSFYRLVYTVG